MSPRRPRSTLAIARLWLPTAASTSMLTLEIPLLLALAARVGDHLVAVAGLGLALGIIVPINSGALALATTSAVAVQRGWRRRTVRRYALLVGGAACGLLAVVWSGCLDGAVAATLGVQHDTWEATRLALLGLAPAPLFVAVRRYNQGYLIASGETAWFLPATLARMSTSVLLAALFTQAFGAGTAGIGLALTIGVAVEAGLLSIRSRTARAADARSFTSPGLLAIARVHAPLSGAMLLTVMPPTAILLALGIAGGTPEVLAAWPVLFGLAWLVCGTTTDLEAITAANHRASAASAQRFALALGMGLSLLWCALQIDAVANAYFRDFSGLGDATADIALAGIAALLPFPFLCAAREWLRGALVACDRSPNTLAGVGVGFVAMLGMFLVGHAVGLPPIVAAAASVSAGAAAEVIALAAFSPDSVVRRSVAIALRRRERDPVFASRPG